MIPMQGKLGDILRAADGIILLDKAPDFTLGFGTPDIMPDAKIVACAAQSETVTLCNQVFQGNMIWGCIADPMLTVAALAASALRKRSSAWKTSVNKLLVKRPDQVTKTKQDQDQDQDLTEYHTGYDYAGLCQLY
jgi:hypothetical protein